MYVIVMGAGTIGYPLISSLVSSGHEVLAIEPDLERSSNLRRKLGSMFISGRGTSSSVLREAGTNRADIFIATSGNDADNLAACLLAKNLFNAGRTISVVNVAENTELFERAGIDVAVSVTDLVLSSIAGALPAHPLLRLMPVRGRGLEVVGLKLPAGAAVVGRPLKEVQVPYGAHISLIISSAGRAETPTPDTVLEAEDEIIAVSPTESTRSLWETLTELR
jgi:trk system potassium uptake protein TrkA